MSGSERATYSTLDSLSGASAEYAKSLTGELIDGFLEVGELLGKGGMGVVYQVLHREWNRQLAMKVPLALGDQDEVDLRRWVREAHTWIDLGLHPRVVSCWFVRQWKGVPILYLDLFTGGSLKERLEAREGPPQTSAEWGEALTWLIHTCEGLQHAHQMGLVHRDIKPANLLFDSEGVLAVTDFGLGKAINTTETFEGSPLALLQHGQEMAHLESSLTRTGVMSGTPHYAPPEQWMQKQVGPQADIYAFAIMAYEVLTDRHPFEPPGERWNLGQLISAHLMGQPPAPETFYPDVPTPLSELLVNCLGKKAKDRPQSLAEIRDVLLSAFKERTGRDYAFGTPQPLSQRADSLNNKAVSLWSLGLREEAMQAWGEADRLERNHLEVTYNKMVTAWLTGRKSAEEAETAIRELATVSVRGRSSAGLFMVTRGNFQEAVSLLKESLESQSLSEDGTLWRGLGGAFLGMGDQKLARESFQKALSLIPTDLVSKSSLEKVEAGKTDNFEGISAQANWQARGRLDTWVRIPQQKAIALLFGRQLVVVDELGQERVALEMPLRTHTPELSCQGPYLFLNDGQQGWSMLLATFPDWKLGELKGWNQRVLGFIGQKSVLVGDTTLQIKNLSDQAPLGPLLVGNEKQVLCYSVFKGEKKLITGGADRVVRQWDLTDGQCEIEGRGHQDFVSSIALGSQEQLLVSGDRSGSVILWLLPKMEKLHRFEFSGAVSRLVLRGEGRDQILIVDYSPELQGDRTAVIFLDRLQVVFDRPGRYFAWKPGFGVWQQDGFRLIGLPEGVEWRSCRYEESLSKVLSDTKRSRVLTWTEEGHFVSRDLPKTLPEPPTLPLVRANTLSEVQQARSQFATLMEAAWASYRTEDWSEAYWQLSRARLVEGYSREPETLEFLARLAKRLHRRELREMWKVRELSPPGSDRSSQLAIDFRGAWAATSSGNIIRLWDLKNGTCIRGLTGHRDEVVHLEFWEGGLGYGAAPLLLSFGADRQVRLWNPNSGDCLQNYRATEDPIVCVSVSGEHRTFALVNREGEIHLGQWAEEEPFQMSAVASEEYSGIPQSVSLSDDGKLLMVSDDKSHLYRFDEDGGSLKSEREFPHQGGLLVPRSYHFLGLNSEGKMDLVHLSKKTTGLREFPGDIGKLKSVTVTADGGLAAALDSKNMLRLWLLDSSQCVLERPFAETLTRILFSGNGRYLAGLTEKGSLLIWELEWQLDPSRPRVTFEEVEESEASQGFWGKVKSWFGA